VTFILSLVILLCQVSQWLWTVVVSVGHSRMKALWALAHETFSTCSLANFPITQFAKCKIVPIRNCVVRYRSLLLVSFLTVNCLNCWNGTFLQAGSHCCRPANSFKSPHFVLPDPPVDIIGAKRCVEIVERLNYVLEKSDLVVFGCHHSRLSTTDN